MAALTHAESRRLYSWWWSSHISPKNSKWLQENLTGMDAKVKAMIKLIEEDADSFARRAEMYYKKRPELMKMVEEFYRAYRALAERYDHAMGELRQAHRTMADAFSNQMPFVIPEESLSASSDTEPQSPVTPHPIRSLLDFDDLQKDTQQSSPHSHLMRRAGAYSEDGKLHTSRKGLKQLNERSLGSETSFGSETRFLAEEKSSSNYKEAVLKEEEVKKLQNELSKLSSENQNLASRILLVTERSDKVETEVHSLRDSLSTLETEKASAIHQYEQCLKKVSSLEAEISQERTFTGKLSGFEERCHLLETLNQSLQLEVDALLHKAELQEKVIVDKQEELKKLDSLIKEEQHSLMQASEALHSLERLQGQCEEEKRILVLELGVAKQNLREVETMKRELEQEVQKIEEDNHSLHEHNLSSDLIIKNLQDEILSLKEAKQGLDEEVRLLMSKQSALQQQLSYLKGDMEDLGTRHQFVIEQIESVGFNVGTFHSSIKELQDETSKLKSIFIKEKVEKLNLLNELGEMEKVSEKCSLLESSLSDANNELEVLRHNLKGQVESFLSLQTEKATLQTEKNLLISRVDHIAENLKQISVKNAILENSLSDLTVELDRFRVKSKDLEESSLSLQSENSRLLSERDDLVTQVETIQASLEDLERKFSELEDRNSCLHEERELALKQISELELLLAKKNEEHLLFAESSNSQVVNLEHQIGVLQAEVASRNRKIEEEQEEHFSAHTEVLVLQSCIINMKEQNDGLFGEIRMHNEALLKAKNHVSELQTEVLELKEKVKLMFEKKLKQREVMNQVSRSLGMDTVDNYDDDIEDHKVLHQLSGKVENLQWSMQHAEDEIEQLVFERSINNLVLEEMRHEGLNLKSEKERLEHNLMIKMEELSFLHNEASKLLEMENLLEKEVEASMHREVILKTERDSLSSQLSEVRKAHLTLANENYELLEENQSWKKEFCFLRDEKYILEEEYTALLKEALSLRCLSLIFEKFSSEKATELRELCSEVEDLHKVNCDLREVSEMTDQRFRDVELENVLLMDTVVKLEDNRSKTVGLENELLRIKGHTEELTSKIEMGKKLLNQQEIDLSDAAWKIEVKNVENIKLQEDVITLKEECFEAKKMIEILQQCLTLAEDKARYDEKHYIELLGREEWLMSELQRNINEVEFWETEAVELYKGLQVAGVIASVFKQKAYELGGKCDSLQEHFLGQMQNYELNKALRDADNEKMKAKLFALELENEELQHEVTVVLPLIISLKETIFLLEEQALSFTKLHDKEMQIPNSRYDQQPESVCPNDRTMRPSELLGTLQEKVHAAAIAVLELKAYFLEENAKANEQLETAKMEIEELKGRIKMMPGDVGSTRNARLLNDEGDISHTRMKDIQLDHVSNRASPRLTSDVYAGSIHLSGEIESFNFEKDLAVDKIELSRLSGGIQEGSRKIREKLVSDAERLTNIQASVLDMENRIEGADKDKLTSFEYNSLMAQLREIEVAISQLLEMSGKLIKAAEEESLGSGRRIRLVDERGLSWGRQDSEQARRWSEKIARMELEVQQIRFLLFKLEEEYDRKGKKTLERRRVQLRDYLYGGTYDTYRKKKRYLCACMEPSTKED